MLVATRAVGRNQALSPTLTVSDKSIAPQFISKEIGGVRLADLRRSITACRATDSPRILLLETELQLLQLAARHPSFKLFSTYTSVELYNDICYWCGSLGTAIYSSRDPIFHSSLVSVPSPKRIDNGSKLPSDKLAMLCLCDMAQKGINTARRVMRGVGGVDLLRVRLRSATLELRMLRQSVEGPFEPITSLPALFNSVATHLRLVRRGCQERGLAKADQIMVLNPIPKINYLPEVKAMFARVIDSGQTELAQWVRKRYQLEEVFDIKNIDEEVLFGLERDLAALWTKALDGEDTLELGALEGEVRLLSDRSKSPDWNLLRRARTLFTKYE